MVVNLESRATEVVVTARDLDGNKQAERSLTLEAGGFVAYDDIRTQLNLSESFGPLEIVSPTGNRLQAASRVYGDERTGGYFEAAPVE